MMTELYSDVLKIEGTLLKPASRFPALRRYLHDNISWITDESDELFINYGSMDSMLPHSLLDEYSLDRQTLSFPTMVLENDYLKAVFIPELGARLWSLYDKKAGRDLIYRNSRFQLGNLAIRNAWFAGGIEWNFGRRGHDANTCLPVFTAIAGDDDGHPVLRFYDYSRERNATRQMDFSLPPESRFLFARMRIVNPNRCAVPMYHWSNIAVAEEAGQRIIVPAETTFANRYVSETEHALQKMPMPYNDGIDCTYPVNYWSVKDHFFNIPDDQRKFQLAVFKDGYGLAYCSTSRLKGRKLFVWGQCPGGQHWQQRLAPAGNYLEIQGGLAKTQLEHLPMPPLTAWEWLEAFGAVRMRPQDAFGSWPDAVVAAQKAIPPQEFFDREFAQRDFVTKPASQLLSRGAGWGALENLRRSQAGLPPLSGHLDFGAPGPEQSPWVELLTRGTITEAVPSSFMVQEEWFELLKKARKSPAVNYHLALNWYFRKDYERAESRCGADNAWDWQLRANILRMTGRLKEAAQAFETAMRLDKDLTCEAFKTMREAETWQRMIDNAPYARMTPMAEFFLAGALAHSGRLAEAEKMLAGLEVPDLREGEISLSDLYVYIQCEKAKREKRTVLPEQIEIPFHYDFRMTQRDADRRNVSMPKTAEITIPYIRNESVRTD